MSVLLSSASVCLTSLASACVCFDVLASASLCLVLLSSASVCLVLPPFFHFVLLVSSNSARCGFRILKPDFQTGHPQPRIDHLRAGFSPDSVCLIRRKSPSPTPSLKPSQTGKADSCFLFWHGAGGQKTLNHGNCAAYADANTSLMDTHGVRLRIFLQILCGCAGKIVSADARGSVRTQTAGKGFTVR